MDHWFQMEGFATAQDPMLEGSLVKDLGTVWQQQLPHKARSSLAPVRPVPGPSPR